MNGAMRGLALLLAAAALAPRAASAQDAIHLNQYRPAPTVRDGMVLSRPNDQGHLLFGARLDLDYALDPLVVERMAGDAGTESGSLVEHQLTANLAVSLGLFERLVVYAGVPIQLAMEGEPFMALPGGDGAGLGDVFIGARGRLYGEEEDPFAVSLQLTATFPTGAAANEEQHYSGEGGVTLHPAALLEVRPITQLRVTANLGARIRTTENARVANLNVSHELTWGIGASVDVIEELLAAYLEGWGSATFENIGQEGARESTPFEWMVGARLQAHPGLQVGLGVGTGLSRGYGTPDFRTALTVGYAQPAPEAEGPVAPGDRDGDGLTDDVDECPDEPEDRDSFEDEDGCPDPDNDQDGILDGPDECPMEAEDRDGFEDENGCPDPDNDQDQILDEPDGCPDEAEDRDEFEDEDGCPDLDNDQDGLPDTIDECPNEPETQNNYQDDDGCPDEPPSEVELRQELERVFFPHDQSRPTAASLRVLRSIGDLFRDHPEWIRVRIDGHASSDGDPEHNEQLSRRRAEYIRTYLIRRGVDESRLEVAHHGAEALDVRGDSEEAHAQNRRVTFEILERAPAEDAAPASE